MISGFWMAIGIIVLFIIFKIIMWKIKESLER